MLPGPSLFVWIRDELENPQKPRDGLQVPYDWLNSMVYMVETTVSPWWVDKPTHTYLGGEPYCGMGSKCLAILKGIDSSELS